MVLKLYLERAQNEFELARIIIQITGDEKMQQEVFKVSNPLTFYSAAISHAYYCIFYSAKAYLLKKGIKVSPPEEHRKTYEAFKSMVDKGELDVELLMLYEKVLIKADKLLDIFRIEKKKRGDFTYSKLAQANKEPAEESIEHAREFFRHVYGLCEK